MSHPLELGAPAWEFNRSLAAQSLADLARRSELFLYHYEYRTCLEVPEAWLPDQRQDLGQLPTWQAGVLAEQKYQSFRNDLMIGSFHPHHQSAWSIHELCHGLVGFAWSKDRPPLFHSLAARLSELLPVALFYFFDDASARRCWRHETGRPLFAAPCAACEREALQGPADLDSQRISEGVRFMDRELTAIHRSKQLGRSVPHHEGALNLASDALAYISAQWPRLQSEPCVRLIEQFHQTGQGYHRRLDELEARIEKLRDFLVEGNTCEPWTLGRDAWVAQDIGGRLIQVWAECDGEARNELDVLIDRLASNHRALAGVINDYVELAEMYVIPNPESLFSVGYDLGRGWGRSLSQIEAGLRSGCPTTLMYLEDEPSKDLHALVGAFVEQDRPLRRPLVNRFSDFLGDDSPPFAQEIARFEAALSQPLTVDEERISLAIDIKDAVEVGLASDCRLVHLSAESARILEINDGEEALVAVQPNPSGDLDVKIIDPSLAADLIRGEPPQGITRDLLIHAGIMVPNQYPK